MTVERNSPTRAGDIVIAIIGILELEGRAAQYRHLGQIPTGRSMDRDTGECSATNHGP